jgi:UDPglucose 6-dehydrogenase
VNEAQKRLLLDHDRRALPDGLDGRRFGVWGLSFKPETDDMREAPSIVVIEGCSSAGAQVTAHDPEALDAARSVFGDRIGYVDNNYDALTTPTRC